jgi:hypothetical protein
MGRQRSRIVEDGYRWHKYGAKLVKGTQQHRSYFKCVAPGCGARKKLWKGENDEEVVVYDGEHSCPGPNAGLLGAPPGDGGGGGGGAGGAALGAPGGAPGGAAGGSAAGGVTPVVATTYLRWRGALTPLASAWSTTAPPLRPPARAARRSSR